MDEDGIERDILVGTVEFEFEEEGWGEADDVGEVEDANDCGVGRSGVPVGRGIAVNGSCSFSSLI